VVYNASTMLMDFVPLISLTALSLYGATRPKKPKPGKYLQPEKFKAHHSFHAPVKKYVIPDAAYEYAEKKISASAR
jgi:hypothetical protein